MRGNSDPLRAISRIVVEVDAGVQIYHAEQAAYEAGRVLGVPVVLKFNDRLFKVELDAVPLDSPAGPTSSAPVERGEDAA